MTLVAAVYLSGCAELADEFSSWPERDASVDKALKPSEGPAGAGPESSPLPEAEAPKTPTTPEIYKGTGHFVNQPHAPARIDAEGGITLNFADTNIREVVRVVLGDILGQNYVIDPSIQGTVTIQTSHPLAEAALLPTLETLLQLNSAALIDDAGIYRIVPIADASKEASAFGVGRRRLPQERGYGVQIVPLQNVSVSEIMKVLTPIVAESNILYTDTARNLLMLGGTRRELDTILETIAIFDVDWLAGMSFGYFPLEEAEATQVVEELKQILTESENAPLVDLLRFVPIERLNALIVISPNPAYIEKASTWIERLDRTGDQDTARLFVYYVQNKRAADLAEVLSQIFGGTGTAARRPGENLRPGLEPISLQSAAGSEQASTATTLGTTTGTGTAAGTTTGTAALGAASRTSSRTGRRSTARQQAGAPIASSATLTLGENREARIIADDSNNALVIMATPGDYRMLESTLRKLDRVPLQVLIEATIAEVALKDELKYGLQWFFEKGNHQLNLGDTLLPVPTVPGFNYVFSTNSVRVVLSALDGITDVNVISSPQLMVLDNTTAFLQVGDEVPIATQSAVSTVDPEAPIVNSIEQRDTGVILTVTPRVNASGMVVMEIAQEISDVVATESSGIDSPTIAQRRIETTVAVQSGETVALGGLIRESRDRSKSGLPILHELPVIGSLFGTTGDTRERTELLIVITPRVVRSVDEARQVTDDLRRRVRSISPLDRKIR